MPRPLRIALLAALAFLVVLVARWPARWVVPRGGNIACESVDGSLWSGGCNGLTVARAPYGDLTWDIAPLSLFTGTLAAHVVAAHGPVSGSADIARSIGGNIRLRNLSIDLPLDPRQLPHAPPQLRGSVHADLALVRIEHGALVELKGRIEAHDLTTHHMGQVSQIGSYVLTFPGGSGEPTGTLADLGGPLAVAGTLRLTREPGYVLEGQVAPRAGASPEVLRDLQMLGTPDGQGRRPFSVAGTF